MVNFSLGMGLNQHQRRVGMLLTIALTTCSASQSPPSANISPTGSSSIASSPILSTAAPTQSTASPTPPTVSQAQTVGAEPLQQQAVQVIRDYYRSIALRHYEQAYSAWEREGAASQQSFEQFRQGFANTGDVAVEVGEPGRLDGAAGSSYIEIPVRVTAITTNGTVQRFQGSYVLRRVNDVSGSTSEQRRWHLYSARLTQTN